MIGLLGITRKKKKKKEAGVKRVSAMECVLSGVFYLPVIVHDIHRLYHWARETARPSGCPHEPIASSPGVRRRRPRVGQRGGVGSGGRVGRRRSALRVRGASTRAGASRVVHDTFASLHHGLLDILRIVRTERQCSVLHRQRGGGVREPPTWAIHQGDPTVRSYALQAFELSL